MARKVVNILKIIKRQMNSNDAIKTANDNIEEYLPFCQASFNSDGNITLRNYDRSDKNKDEIIVLSESETRALFSLFSKMTSASKAYDLPF